MSAIMLSVIMMIYVVSRYDDRGIESARKY
jgi:hypothetical protein